MLQQDLLEAIHRLDAQEVRAVVPNIEVAGIHRLKQDVAFPVVAESELTLHCKQIAAMGASAEYRCRTRRVRVKSIYTLI